jgi:hypothetical protein
VTSPAGATVAVHHRFVDLTLLALVSLSFSCFSLGLDCAIFQAIVSMFYRVVAILI